MSTRRSSEPAEPRYRKPRADVYTVLLAIALVAIVLAIIMMYREMKGFYDFQYKGASRGTIDAGCHGRLASATRHFRQNASATRHFRPDTTEPRPAVALLASRGSQRDPVSATTGRGFVMTGNT